MCCFWCSTWKTIACCLSYSRSRRIVQSSLNFRCSFPLLFNWKDDTSNRAHHAFIAPFNVKKDFTRLQTALILVPFKCLFNAVVGWHLWSCRTLAQFFLLVGFTSIFFTMLRSLLIKLTPSKKVFDSNLSLLLASSPKALLPTLSPWFMPQGTQYELNSFSTFLAARSWTNWENNTH